MPRRKFGRDRLPDERDHNYPIENTPSRRLYRYWNANGWWGDQGYTSECVGYAFAHWLEDGPITHKGKAPLVSPGKIYRDAQVLDEWVGTDYDGTSIRGGAKALSSMGWVSEYQWTWDITVLINALLEQGPVVLGTNWTTGMDNWDKEGVIRAAGRTLGGHAYLANGINLKRGLIRCKNSWGRAWCRQGLFYIPIEDMEDLIHDDGEVCLAIECPKLA